jgi:methyl-accepting chemotaxis protein
MDKAQITKAIGAHGMWKNRLKGAISNGGSDIKAATAGRDDACDFGKWLLSVPAGDRDAQWAKVSELHKIFHQAVGEVLRKLEAGDKSSAEQLTANDSAFSMASARCTVAMLEWSKQLS